MAWGKWGRTPGELFEKMTPGQFVILFTKSPTTGIDRLEILTALNRERGRKGLRPVFPSWLE